MASGGAVPAAPVLSGTYVTPETALSLASVYAAVNVISRDMASMPRNVYRKLPGGGRVIDESHPVNALLRVSPNGEIGAYRWMQTSMSHVLTRGNGYSEIVRDKRTGEPRELHILHPSKTVPKRTEGGRLYYELNDGITGQSGVSKKIDFENVLHLAGMGFNGIQGFSPITVARQTIGLGIAAEQFGASFFGNSAIASGFLKHPGKLSELALNNLRRTFNQIHQGSQSAHQFGILEQGMDWVSNQISPEDGQFIETRTFQVKDIARLYGLPPHKIGDYSESHLANVEEANLDYITMTLFGWVCMVEDESNLKLLTAEDRQTHEIGVDMSALTRGNLKARSEYNNIMRNMGCYSADDILLREGQNPIGPAKGGDKYIVQSQYMPLDQVGRQPVAPPSKPVPEKNERFSLNGSGEK